MSWFSDFATSPGAAGVGAVTAAVLVGLSALRVSAHRRRDADLDREQAQRNADLDREQATREAVVELWWERYVWSLSTASDGLPPPERFLFVHHLVLQAEQLEAPDLVQAAKSYLKVLNQKILLAMQHK